MKVLTALTFLLVFSYTFGNQEWDSYKKQYGKVYKDPIEDSFRLKLYLDKKIRVEKHNELYRKGFTTFTMGINRFTDMTDLEVDEMMNGFRQPSDYQHKKVYQNKMEVSSVPAAIDWRNQGYVTEVKDQANCGSCWAFSATGALEGQNFAKSGKLVSLSEQNLVDCSRAYNTSGCEGGWMDQAFVYVALNGGIDTEESYGYEGVEGVCRFNVSNVGGTCSGYVDLASGDENLLKSAVGIVGPVSVVIDASRSSFQSYSGGIYYDASCNPQNLNHGVLVVGYDTSQGQDYWIVKNSWGVYWGEEGYIRMSRNKNNNCGIASAASFPLV